MTFQRFGRPSTEIHRWTIATKTKNITHSDRKAASLSRRIANLYFAESQAFQIFFLQGTEIQQQEEIRSAKFLVQCRRPAYHCTNAKIALDETRQLLEERLFIADRQIGQHANKSAVRRRINTKYLRRIIPIFQEGKNGAHFRCFGGVQATASEQITYPVNPYLFGDRFPHQWKQRAVAKILASAGAA